ncbi:hydroxyacid dehydrogenase [Paenibacillus sp. 1P07SE]|uniref:hydroxyacid dehydrogenase n=1 Tax=Paenibacillus sp. 1P07SE TaxID=3132209 RepID=UPI0039A45B2B
MLKGIYILSEKSYPEIYPEHVRKKIDNQVLMVPQPYTPESIAESAHVLQDVELLFSGWGAPKLDEAFLKAAPRLKMVFYGAGSVKGMVTEAFWRRGIRLTSAYAANAIPVAEYTVSQIVFALKNGWRLSRAYQDRKTNNRIKLDIPVVGTFGSTVGLISLGMIARQVCQRLKAYDMNVIAYDPFATREQAEAMGVQLCSLDELFERSDVVSLHAPWLEETVGMITGEHFRRMKPGATFLNTARGAIVREPEMIEALQARPDLFAILDVTYPEPPADDSPLYTLPNVVLTPHIAGSMGNEVARMGMFMADELGRYLAGEPLAWEIDEKKAAILA